MLSAYYFLTICVVIGVSLSDDSKRSANNVSLFLAHQHKAVGVKFIIIVDCETCDLSM